MGTLYKVAITRGGGRHAELLALAVLVAGLTWASPTFVAFVYLPVWSLGQATAEGVSGRPKAATAEFVASRRRRAV